MASQDRYLKLYPLKYPTASFLSFSPAANGQPEVTTDEQKNRCVRQLLGEQDDTGASEGPVSDMTRTIYGYNKRRYHTMNN